MSTLNELETAVAQIGVACYLFSTAADLRIAEIGTSLCGALMEVSDLLDRYVMENATVEDFVR